MKRTFKIFFYIKESDFKNEISRFDVKQSFKEKDIDDQWILCSICKNRITKTDQAIEVNGRHLQTFINPNGIYFNIRCFKNAEGVAVSSSGTDNFTWFPGYSWRVTLCSNCNAHNGWKFDSGNNSFYGFIDEKLIIK